MRTLFIILGGCSLMLLAMVGGCVGCAALVISEANKYDIDAGLVSQKHAADLEALRGWLALEPYARDTPDVSPVIVGVMREEPQEVGTSEYSVFYAAGRSLSKNGHFIWNGTGHASITLDGQDKTVVVREMAVGGTDYLILIDDPTLLQLKKDDGEHGQ